MKRNISDTYDKNYINSLIAGYYTKVQTDNLLNNKLDSSIISSYNTITQTSSLYVSKATFDANIYPIVNSLAGKVESSDLITYHYNKITTNSILENYYNKTSIDNKFNEYQNITCISTLLDNYYDKDYVDLTLGVVYSISI